MAWDPGGFRFVGRQADDIMTTGAPAPVPGAAERRSKRWGNESRRLERMKIITLLAAAVLAVPLAGAAQGHGVRKAGWDHGKHYAGARHKYSYKHYRRHPRVAGFRFAAGGHANGYEYESYAEYNYRQSRQFGGFFGYSPHFDNRSFAETNLGGGIRFGGDRP